MVVKRATTRLAAVKLQLAATRYGNDDRIRNWNIGMLQLADAHRGCSMLDAVARGASHAVQGSIALY